jgi:hypothetical protein
MAYDLTVQELLTEIDVYRWICIHALESGMMRCGR